MNQIARDASWLGATVVVTAVVAMAALAVIRPCSVSGQTDTLIGALSVTPAAVVFIARFRRTGYLLQSVSVGIGAALLLGVVFAVEVPRWFGASRRWRQKQAMAQLRSLGVKLEAQRASGTLKARRWYGPGSPWGQPVLIESSHNHYVIVSAGECGSLPQRADLSAYVPGPTTAFGSDLVFADGKFVAYPEGVQQ